MAVPMQGGAGGTNSGSGTGATSGTNPYTGWASQFSDPAALQNVYDSPWALLPNIYKNINTSGSGYNALRDLGADPLTLFTIMNGGRSAGSGFGANEGDYANFLNNLYSSYGGQAGQTGRGFSSAELTSNIFNSDPNSALGQTLSAGDSNQQLRTIFNMLRDVSNVGMTPIAARAYQSMAQKTGDQALNQIINASTAGSGAANQNVASLLRRINPQLMVGER